MSNAERLNERCANHEPHFDRPDSEPGCQWPDGRGLPATTALRTLADKRKAEADKARAAAGGKAATHEKRADYTLGLRPKNPADMCGSMQALGDEWLKARAKP